MIDKLDNYYKYVPYFWGLGPHKLIIRSRSLTIKRGDSNLWIPQTIGFPIDYASYGHLSIITSYNWLFLWDLIHSINGVLLQLVFRAISVIITNL